MMIEACPGAKLLQRIVRGKLDGIFPELHLIAYGRN
jgi:hypothetical protein